MFVCVRDDYLARCTAAKLLPGFIKLPPCINKRIDSPTQLQNNQVTCVCLYIYVGLCVCDCKSAVSRIEAQ